MKEKGVNLSKAFLKNSKKNPLKKFTNKTQTQLEFFTQASLPTLV